METADFVFFYPCHHLQNFASQANSHYEISLVQYREVSWMGWGILGIYSS